MNEPRLTPQEFKGMIRAKGWTYRELAETRWNCTPEWLSMVGRNPDRPVRYDDQVRGLPDRRPASASRPKQPKAATVLAAGLTLPKGPAFRYHKDLRCGAVVSASDDVGSVAEVGARGEVAHVITTVRSERYLVVFENGAFDFFGPDDVDRYLVFTGIVDEGATGYRYTTFDQLKADFETKVFSFGRP
jgi:hypothetical protein